MISYLFQDYSSNKGSPKIIFSLIFFRLVQLLAHKKYSLVWWFGLPLIVIYRVIVEWLLCLELRPGTRVGPGLRIEHGYSLVINDRAVLGRNVHLRHCVTIGCIKNADGSQGPSPILGDDVEVGANSVILGGITIGSGAKIGAGSVVVGDVPSNAVVVGNPARVVRIQIPS